MQQQNLHYTLLLLIRKVVKQYNGLIIKFTLHFATINTISYLLMTMKKYVFTLHFATINTSTSK